MYHFINWNYEHTVGAALASIIFNGSDAVSFFFVLSGFVLSYKYIVLGQPLDIGKFYVARLFRLWPGFVVTIIALTLNNARYEFNWQHLCDVFGRGQSSFWEEVFLLRTRTSTYTPGWTLSIELILSFFIPFHIAIAKMGKRYLWWLFIAFALAHETFQLHFVMGVAISCLYKEIESGALTTRKWYPYRGLLLLVAIILFSIRHITRISPLGPSYVYLAEYLDIPLFLYTGVGSFMLIVAIVNSKRTRQLLDQKVLLFIGKISYGIYLVHWALVGDIFSYWKNILPLFPNEATAFAACLVGYVVATLFLASLMHYAIELPFIRIGKKMGLRMKPTVVVR